MTNGVVTALGSGGRVRALKGGRVLATSLGRVYGLGQGPRGVDFEVGGDASTTMIKPSAPRLARTAADRANDQVDVLDYATSLSQRTAIRTGNTAVNEAWADVIADAADLGFRAVRMPGGNYESEADARLINTGLAIIGEPGKTVIRKNGLNSLFKAAGGGIGTAYALAGDAAVGAITIQVETGAGADLVVGQTYVLRSMGRPGNVNMAGRRAEFVTVQAIDGDSVTFWAPVHQAFLVSDTAQIAEVDLLEGVAYRDLQLFMDPATEIADSNAFQEAFGFDLAWCKSPEIVSAFGKDGIHAFIRLAGCLNARLLSISARDFGSTTTGGSDPSSSQGLGGYGYGIREENLNMGLVASMLHFERMRHGYTTIHGYGGIDFPGVPIGSVISNGTHIDSRNAAWDTHSGGLDITFSDLHAVGGQLCAFHIRSRRTKLFGCSAIGNLGAAVWLRGGEGALTAADHCTVRGFSSYNTNNIDDTLNSIDWREKGAITDAGYYNSIEARVERCGGPALSAGASQVGKAWRGRYDIEAIDPCQLAATATVALDIGDTVLNGDFKIKCLDVESTDGKVVNLVRRANAAWTLDARGVTGRGYTGRAFDLGTSDANFTARDCDGFKIMERRGPRVVDEFAGRALTPDWLTLKGSSASFPVIVATSACRLTTGANATTTMVVNGSRLEMINGWRSWKALSLEWRVKVDDPTNLVMFVGFTTATNALLMPAQLGAGDALTLDGSETDMVGFVFDTDADTDQWHCVAANNSTGKAPVATGLAPVSGAYERLRVELDESGNATFLRNGRVVGAIASAVATTAYMTPVAAVLSRSAAARSLDIDYCEIEAIGEIG